MNNTSAEDLRNISTEELLKSNNMLSIHQMGAMSIANNFRKIITTGKPEKLYNVLTKTEGRTGTLWKTTRKTPRLTITASSFIEKGLRIWNKLDQEIKEVNTEYTFKKKFKPWATLNIPIKPG